MHGPQNAFHKADAAMNMIGSILIVDDEPSVRTTLAALLRHAGHTVTEAASGEEAIALLGAEEYDLLLADLKMPGVDGLAVVQAAQARDPQIVCIILTGHGSLDSAIGSLRLDIFDYLLKTVDPQEVVKRVAAGLRRRAERQRQRTTIQQLVAVATALGARSPSPDERPVSPGAVRPVRARRASLVIGRLAIDPIRQTAIRDGRTVALTPTELRVLLYLAEHAGTLVPYAELVQRAQSYPAVVGTEAADLIKPHLHHLRQKLESDPTHPHYLLNVRGQGYLLAWDKAAAA